MITFIKEFNLARISLSVFHEPKNSTLTRMMALKFFKSLYSLPDKNLLLELCDACPLRHALPLLLTCRSTLSHLTMLQSSVLDLYNCHGLTIHKHFGQPAHQKMLTPYLKETWAFNLIDKFFYPTGKRPKKKKG